MSELTDITVNLPEALKDKRDATISSLPIAPFDVEELLDEIERNAMISKN